MNTYHIVSKCVVASTSTDPPVPVDNPSHHANSFSSQGVPLLSFYVPLFAKKAGVLASNSKDVVRKGSYKGFQRSVQLARQHRLFLFLYFPVLISNISGIHNILSQNRHTKRYFFDNTVVVNGSVLVGTI